MKKSKPEYPKRQEEVLNLLMRPVEKLQENTKKHIAELVEGLNKRALLAQQTAVDAMSLAEKSQTDHLTSLPGRGKFLGEVKEYLAKTPPPKVAVLFLDLDSFKQRNDSFGHDIGDETLRELAKFLKGKFGEQAFYGRWGGEEFVVVIPNETATNLKTQFPEFSFTFTSKIRRDLELKTTASVGAANWEYGYDLEDVIKNADHTMYVKKNKGKNGVEVYNEEIEEEFQRLMAEKQNKKGY